MSGRAGAVTAPRSASAGRRARAVGIGEGAAASDLRCHPPPPCVAREARGDQGHRCEGSPYLPPGLRVVSVRCRLEVLPLRALHQPGRHVSGRPRPSHHHHRRRRRQGLGPAEQDGLPDRAAAELRAGPAGGPPGAALMAYSCNSYGESLLQLQANNSSWPTAATPVENPCCSCKLTRNIRSWLTAAIPIENPVQPRRSAPPPLSHAG